MIGPLTSLELEDIRAKINELVDFMNELEIAMDEIGSVAEANRESLLHEDDLDND